MSVLLIAGTRPNFMKVASLWRGLEALGMPARLLHTGQHYDAAMSEVFFSDLGLPTPHVSLRAGGGTHAEQTAAVLVGVEAELLRERPGAVVVVGDVTSTMAAALAAAKLGIPVVHVEAGLRSRDWTMPEEVNRVVTDQLSDLLLIPSEDARPNLLAEGIAPERVLFVGNVMIDALHYALARRTDALARLELSPGGYALATLHRPANVDDRASLSATLDALGEVSRRIPVLFPVHPRTTARAAALGLGDKLHGMPGLRPIDPLGYRDFVTLLASARLAATDSGGIQEETTALGIPCLTLREGTERPVTVTEGTNVIVGLDRARIAQETERVLSGNARKGRVPAGWDGGAGLRVAEALRAFLAGSPPARTVGPRA